MDKPFPAYEGDEPYVFVCYAHDDEATVFPDMQWLREQGINLWYDEGISGGKVWRAEILKELQGASKVLYYISAASLQSIHCNREIDYAVDNLAVIPVYLDESELTPELDLALHRVQALHHSDDTRYQQLLLDALRQSTAVRGRSVSNHKKSSRGLYAGLGLVLVALLGGAWWYAQRPATADRITPAAVDEIRAPTIAVLPLSNISGDESQNYFSLGFTQEIWNKVREIPGLQVIATTSSSRFLDSTLGAIEIGQQLNASYLLEGTVNRSGNLVRVSVNLIDAETGIHILGRDYNQAINDVESLFAIYDDLANEIGSTLTGFIGDKDQPSKLPTESLAAYELLQQGRWEYDTNYQNVKALALFNQALELDPDSLEIQEQRLYALYQVADTGEVPSKVGYEVARKAARKVLAVDPENPVALYVQANLTLALDLDFRKALDRYDRAERAGFSEDGMPIHRALIHINAGDPQQAVALMEKAELLDPEGTFIKTILAVCLYFAGDIEASNRKFDEALALAPYNRYTVRMAIGLAAWAKDIGRLRLLIEAASARDGVVEDYARPLLQLLEGDAEPLRKLVEGWRENLENTFVFQLTFTQMYYFLGDYANHFRSFAVQEKEFSTLHLTNMNIVSRRNYWENLEAWADSDTEKQAERHALLEEHRARIARVTEKMVL